MHPAKETARQFAVAILASERNLVAIFEQSLCQIICVVIILRIFQISPFLQLVINTQCYLVVMFPSRTDSERVRQAQTILDRV